jgi:hypothetical protein
MNKVNVKAILALGLVFVISLSLPALGEDPDYGNDPCSAHPIDPNGTLVWGILSSTSDQDWFSFTAGAKCVYEITLRNPSSQMCLEVRGPAKSEQQITSFCDSGTHIVKVFIDSAGTCWLNVFTSPWYGGGSYGVSVNLVRNVQTDTYPDTCFNPTVLTVDAPALYDGITNSGIDEDWFRFDTVALHKYQITLTPANNSDVGFELRDTNCGDLLFSSYVYPYTNTITFVSWDGAEYDLMVFSQSFKEGYYEISVQDLGQLPDDHGNTCDTATPIQTNGTLVGGILQYTANVGSDEDWFSFTAGDKCVYEITLRSQSGTKNLEICGPDDCDQQITSFDASSGVQTNWVFIDGAGTCWLRVHSGSGSYAISVNLVRCVPTDTYPDTCFNPAVLTVGAPPIYDGITNYGMDEDWFTFATAALHKYQITLTKAYNSDVGFELCRINCGDLLYSAYAYGLDPITFVSWDGAYYDLRVFSRSFKEGYYEISVQDLGQLPDDHGNTCDTATPIQANGVYAGGILQYTATVGSDEDWFSFPAVAQGLYDVTLRNQGGGQKCVQVLGLDNCGQLIAEFCAYSGESTRTISIEVVGTYSLRIYSPSSETGSYAVKVLSPQGPEPRCGDLNHPYPGGDANHDCVVNLEDLAILADNWLADNRP